MHLEIGELISETGKGDLRRLHKTIPSRALPIVPDFRCRLTRQRLIGKLTLPEPVIGKTSFDKLWPHFSLHTEQHLPKRLTRLLSIIPRKPAQHTQKGKKLFLIRKQPQRVVQTTPLKRMAAIRRHRHPMLSRYAFRPRHELTGI